jgi:heavy metal sensor kinase
VKESAYRIYSRQGRVEEMPPVIIRAARPLEPLYEELGFLALVLALGIPLAVALAAGGGYTLARRALAPVDRMAGQAKRITADELGERLPVENPEDELGRLAATFNRMFARLEHSFEQLRRFTADASHELRTPLTVIRSVGEVGLEERRGEEQYREIIGSMLEEADRLARLVDSLLCLSRADGGQVRLHLETTDLAVLAEDVAQQLSVLAEEKGMAIHLDASVAAVARVDATVVRQALINLVDNAIKYGAPQSEIRVAVAQVSGRVELTVRDTGPGIAAEHHDRIFDRFYRVDKARSRQMGGAGLGLAIVRWAAEAHGGEIVLESETGRGSTFRIILPQGQE